jgi:lysophospholipase L1-like esterase
VKNGLWIVVSVCTFGLMGHCGVSAIAEHEATVAPAKTPDEIRDDYWRGQFQRVNREVAAANGTQVVFFGDSITLNWSSDQAKGQKIWNEFFAKYQPINIGNSGDITPVMLHRVTHGNLDFPQGQHPKVAVLLCGTNNFAVTQSAGGQEKWDLGSDCPPQDVAHGVRAITQEFRRRLPQTRLIIMGILPVASADKRDKVRQVNQHLAEIEFKQNEAVYVDLWDKFTNEDGSLKKELFTDGTHLTEEGYRVWAKNIAPLIAEMVDAKGR